MFSVSRVEDILVNAGVDPEPESKSDEEEEKHRKQDVPHGSIFVFESGTPCRFLLCRFRSLRHLKIARKLEMSQN